MGLVVITLQDEADGSVSLGFTAEPALQNEEEELTDAQALGVMGVTFFMQALAPDPEGSTEESV